MAIFDLSLPEGKYALAKNAKFQRAVESAISEVCGDIRDGAYNPYAGFLAEDMLISYANTILERDSFEMSYWQTRVLLNPFDSGTIDDNALTTTEWNKIITGVKTYLDLKAKIKESDKTTPKT